MRKLALMIVSAAFAAACSASPVTPDATPAAGAATAEPSATTPTAPEAPVADADKVVPVPEETLTGTLSYEELPATKSVRAYTGEELFLTVVGEAERRVLRPSKAVSRDALRALDGKRVRVRVEWTPGHAPAAGSAYPMGADGGPMLQGTGWRVLQVEAL